MTQPQNRQPQAKTDLQTPNMNVWRLTRRLNKQHEKAVERELLHRMQH